MENWQDVHGPAYLPCPVCNQQARSISKEEPIRGVFPPDPFPVRIEFQRVIFHSKPCDHRFTGECILDFKTMTCTWTTWRAI